jgi:hypothetical protein
VLRALLTRSLSNLRWLCCVLLATFEKGMIYELPLAPLTEQFLDNTNLANTVLESERLRLDCRNHA